MPKKRRIKQGPKYEILKTSVLLNNKNFMKYIKEKSYKGLRSREII